MSKPYPMVPGLFGEDVPLIPEPGTEPDTRKVFKVYITEKRSQEMYVLCKDAREAKQIAEDSMDDYDFEADDPYYSASEADSQDLERIPREELVTADGDDGLTVGGWLKRGSNATKA